MRTAYTIQGIGWAGVACGLFALIEDANISATKADGPDWGPAFMLIGASFILVGLGAILGRLVVIDSKLAVSRSGEVDAAAAPVALPKVGLL